MTTDAPPVTIEPAGKLIHEINVPGETRADDVFPGNGGGIQVSRSRFLFLLSTRGWRGVDDNRSIVYQLRAEGFDGPVIREGCLARTRDDWGPLENGQAIVKAHLHPCAFGVPGGAIVGGRSTRTRGCTSGPEPAP